MKQILLFFIIFLVSLKLVAQKDKYDIYAFEIQKIGWRPAFRK